MIIYIMQDLLMLELTERSSTAEDHQNTADEFNAISSLLNAYCVRHKLELNTEFTKLVIYAQKITLDEFAMNALFYKVIDLHFCTILRYSSSSPGSDFYLQVYRIQAHHD